MKFLVVVTPPSIYQFPTISTEGLVLTCVIDVVNGHGVANSDIPVDFLQTDYNKGDIHIKM